MHVHAALMIREVTFCHLNCFHVHSDANASSIVARFSGKNYELLLLTR